MEIVCFSADVRQYNVGYSVIHLNHFYLFNKAYSCFWLVCTNGKRNVYTIFSIMFKNVLRTFGVEIIKLFKNSQPQLNKNVIEGLLQEFHESISEMNRLYGS